ncbi:hypothetical protein J422_05309 [Methanocaldococcus villosus KIN24-T80]|uniref:Uncharacterized protein n=1 Tax=Methanocaldococcus villosus KIN24-T80 TaxID=1069083 RepID=N6VRV7_9EURY|nr:TatD family hydrolase [Methanocaldococcus villosus]ENN95896.1 hypothetical protein J422_05309 [Methanocaldococcus villosus KIN24-T80]
MIIDTHTHLDTRGYEDLELLAMTLDKAITLAHDPFPMRTVEVFITHIEKVINEIERAKKAGLMVYCALGMHPRALTKNIDEALERLKSYLDKAIAIGEIGLEKATKEEKEAFEKQLLLANDIEKPAIIHTPRRDKREVTKEIIDILSSIDLKVPVIVDHCNKDIINIVLDNNYYAGLTVQPGKLTPMEAVEIIKEYKDFSDRIVLNSDLSSNPSDVLAVPRTVLKLKINNIEKEIIEKVSYKNAQSIFSF